LLHQKGAQNVAILFGYFIFSKNHDEPPKVAHLAKNLIIYFLGTEVLSAVTPTVYSTTEKAKNRFPAEGTKLTRFLN
jgi:hypothetical protein